MRLGKTDGQPRISAALLAAMFVLGALAFVYFARPVYRAFLPLQIENGGAWNAYHADTIRAGLPLYVLDDFISNNYPPLSFYVVSALSAVLHIDVLYIGRVLSLAATVAAAVAVWAASALWADRVWRPPWAGFGGSPPWRSGTRFGSVGTIRIWSRSP